ncbi:MAG: hypothetical protein ACM3PV_07010 [Betaproteobacteria bacterium]
MNRARPALAVAALLAVVAGCRGRTGTGGAPVGGSAGAQALIQAHKYDEAIAQVGAAADPESLYLLGLAWAGKAESAPVPTPGPGSAGAGEAWKPEELRALELLERAVAARPDHAGAHLAIAELLAPHALERQRSGRAARPAQGADGPDASVERVLRSYGDAVQADPAATEAAFGLVRFATAAGRLAEADAAYRELLRRRREDPGLLVRYGDFLAGPMDQPDAALAQYAQALMWRPDDAATRLKVADIHLRAAAGHLQSHEYLPAEARLKEARRAGVDPASPPAARLRALEPALRDVRGR